MAGALSRLGARAAARRARATSASLNLLRLCLGRMSSRWHLPSSLLGLGLGLGSGLALGLGLGLGLG